ncbi:Protein CBR-SRZ-42 [Caenorhabditis briggsae]|uniref:Protein CBR-SRZ-42 n=1 Tax=Caenorhabditis briggsae TaxID=6238 RepID=A8XN26_CAEBR|nr:Protein CBR-SRZ-42 [Caenorhabditis briggsae]CAP34052.1 Protein CBR-SRZ-42 [Caenorhabditis briggsae]
MSDNWYLSAMTAIVDNGDISNWKLSSFLLVIFISLQLLFPFYAYVNRVNRERDKNTLVFPLIDHFYGVMKKTHATFYFVYVVGLFWWFKVEQIPKKMGLTLITILGSIIVCALCLYVLMLFTQVFQFFLTIMAVQKFLLYFHPSSQKHIVLSRKNMQCFIRFTYYLLLFKEAIFFILFWVSIMKEELGEKVTFWNTVKQFELVFFLSTNITFFASALLYIPIFISVRKLSNLRSVQESKPQIYIFWQTATALIMKVIYTSYFLFMYFDHLVDMVLPTRVLDIFSVPVIIQISYLTCNRQNVITLFASFKGRKLIRELLTPEITSAVSPEPRRHMI